MNDPGLHKKGLPRPAPFWNQEWEPWELPGELQLVLSAGSAEEPAGHSAPGKQFSPVFLSLTPLLVPDTKLISFPNLCNRYMFYARFAEKESEIQGRRKDLSKVVSHAKKWWGVRQPQGIQFLSFFSGL